MVSLVVDTNVLMERVSLLRRLCDSLQALTRRLTQQGVTLIPRVVIPSIVLWELDNLKDASKGRGEDSARSASASESPSQASGGQLSAVHAVTANFSVGCAVCDRPGSFASCQAVHSCSKV